VRNYYAPQVRRLQDQGLAPKEIAAFLKIPRQAVYQIRYRDRLTQSGKPIRPVVEKPKTIWDRLMWWRNKE